MVSARNRTYLFCIVFADMLGFSLIFPLFPRTIQHYLQFPSDPVFQIFLGWAEALGESNSELTFVLFGGILGSSYSLLQFLFAPLWGKLSDSWGRRPVLIFTSLGSVLGYTLWLFSSQFWVFVLSRIITGMMGGNLSVAQASMADATEGKDRVKGMGMLGAGIGLGFVMGPLLGGMTSMLPWWEEFTRQGILTIFPMTALLALLFACLNLLFVVAFLPETKPKSDASPPFRFSHPILTAKRLGTPLLFEISFLNLVFSLAFSGFEFTLNFFMAEHFRYTPKEIGFTFLFIGTVIILVQGGLVRRLSGKIPEKKLVLWGGYSLLVGFFSLLFYQSPGFLYFSLFFLAFGGALINPGLSSFASLVSPPDRQGMSLGFFRSFSSLARAVSPITYGLVYFQKGFLFSFGLSTLLVIFFVIRIYRIKENVPASSAE